MHTARKGVYILLAQAMTFVLLILVTSQLDTVKEPELLNQKLCKNLVSEFPSLHMFQHHKWGKFPCLRLMHVGRITACITKENFYDLHKQPMVTHCPGLIISTHYHWAHLTNAGALGLSYPLSCLPTPQCFLNADIRSQPDLCVLPLCSSITQCFTKVKSREVTINLSINYINYTHCFSFNSLIFIIFPNGLNSSFLHRIQPMRYF